MGWKRGRAYSQDLRERVLEARDSGLTCREVAARFDVSVSSVVKVAARRDETGERTPGGRGKPPRKLARYMTALKAHAADHPGATLADRRRWLQESYGVTASLKTIWMALKALGLTLKKSPARRRTAAA